MVGANPWYIVGEDHWYMLGANPWYIIAEDYWYIVARGVTVIPSRAQVRTIRSCNQR